MLRQISSPFFFYFLNDIFFSGFFYLSVRFFLCLCPCVCVWGEAGYECGCRGGHGCRSMAGRSPPIESLRLALSLNNLMSRCSCRFVFTVPLFWLLISSDLLIRPSLFFFFPSTNTGAEEKKNDNTYMDIGVYLHLYRYIDVYVQLFWCKITKKKREKCIVALFLFLFCHTDRSSFAAVFLSPFLSPTTPIRSDGE